VFVGIRFGIRPRSLVPVADIRGGPYKELSYIRRRLHDRYEGMVYTLRMGERRCQKSTKILALRAPTDASSLQAGFTTALVLPPRTERCRLVFRLSLRCRPR
jgi:hypothetical protein